MVPSTGDSYAVCLTPDDNDGDTITTETRRHYIHRIITTIKCCTRNRFTLLLLLVHAAQHYEQNAEQYRVSEASPVEVQWVVRWVGQVNRRLRILLTLKD